MDVTTILAELPHPTTLGGPLARGAKYQHHFVVDLISDGKRYWHLLSAEGQAIISAIKREVSDELDAAESTLAKARAEELAKLQAAKPNEQSFGTTVMNLEDLKKIRDDIDREIAKVSGVSAQPGTSETNADPGNPNTAPTENTSDLVAMAGDDAEAAAKPK